MTKGQRIKEAREAKGYSQTQFADMMNISKQTLYKYEKDIVTNIPSDVIERMANALSVSPGYIMGWSDVEIYQKYLETAKTFSATEWEMVITYIKYLRGEIK